MLVDAVSAGSSGRDCLEFLHPRHRQSTVRPHRQAPVSCRSNIRSRCAHQLCACSLRHGRDRVLLVVSLSLSARHATSRDGRRLPPTRHRLHHPRQAGLHPLIGVRARWSSGSQPHVQRTWFDTDTCCFPAMGHILSFFEVIFPSFPRSATR